MSRAVVERLRLAPSERLLANRATGRIRLSVDAKGSRTHRTSVHEAGSLRVRFPTTAGGMTGGDDFSISLSLDEGAQLLAGTAAAEKIYRSTGADSALALTIDAATGSRCIWLPQETILFDRARLSRRIDVSLSTNARRLMAEAFVFGRSAMGEAVEEGSLIDRWRIRRGGQLVFAENVRLDGAIARTLSRPAVANGGVAIA